MIREEEGRETFYIERRNIQKEEDHKEESELQFIHSMPSKEGLQPFYR